MASVKICGLNDASSMITAIEGGAAFVGLVFYPPSPRHVSLVEAAALAALPPDTVKRVGLFVDADNETIDSTLTNVRLDMIQLHGAESPDRVAALKARTGLPVMKAIKIADAADFAATEPFLGVADQLLFDAKPPKEMTDALPGGNAVSFDWSLLAGRDWPCPWMLSGGLDADNVAEAIRISGARIVDVSSGVERAKGIKDPGKIQAFLAAAAAA